MIRIIIALGLLLHGCTGIPAEPQRVERLSAEALEARLPQPVAAISLEQLVALTHQGIGADELIGRITASGSRYRLSASLIVDLAQQGVPLKVLDHIVVAERTRIFEEMAEDGTRRDKACLERVAQEARLCHSQSMAQPPMWAPWPQPFINCFPPRAGSPYWRCL